MSSPRLIVISGPSGVGKSTLISDLLEIPGVALALSATTRGPRQGERNGVDYHFVSTTEFEHLRQDDQLLEWAEVHGRCYGTPRSEIAKPGAEVILLDIDVQGFRAVQQRGLPITSVFIAPPSIEELERRLRIRASESEEALRTRLQNAANEMAAQDSYDHVIVNRDVVESRRQLRELVLGSTQRIAPHKSQG